MAVTAATESTYTHVYLLISTPCLVPPVSFFAQAEEGFVYREPDDDSSGVISSLVRLCLTQETLCPGHISVYLCQ